jgi:hypothetical protein
VFLVDGLGKSQRDYYTRTTSVDVNYRMNDQH